jgi:hypothetical protein
MQRQKAGRLKLPDYGRPVLLIGHAGVHCRHYGHSGRQDKGSMDKTRICTEPPRGHAPRMERGDARHQNR